MDEFPECTLLSDVLWYSGRCHVTLKLHHHLNFSARAQWLCSVPTGRPLLQHTHVHSDVPNKLCSVCTSPDRMLNMYYTHDVPLSPSGAFCHHLNTECWRWCLAFYFPVLQRELNLKPCRSLFSLLRGYKENDEWSTVGCSFSLYLFTTITLRAAELSISTLCCQTAAVDHCASEWSSAAVNSFFVLVSDDGRWGRWNPPVETSSCLCVSTVSANWL